MYSFAGCVRGLHTNQNVPQNVSTKSIKGKNLIVKPHKSQVNTPIHVKYPSFVGPCYQMTNCLSLWLKSPQSAVMTLSRNIAS